MLITESCCWTVVPSGKDVAVDQAEVDERFLQIDFPNKWWYESLVMLRLVTNEDQQLAPPHPRSTTSQLTSKFYRTFVSWLS